MYGLDNEKDIQKREEEVETKEFEDELATTHYFKVAGEYLYLIGKDWPCYENITACFKYKDKQVVVDCVYKHPTRLGVIIPELSFVEPGIQPVSVEVSFNGQNYSKSGI